MKKIISGGQTGADRAALDWAIDNGVQHAGWCPVGRKAEDGPIHPRYHLTETESARYRTRTVRNVRDSDATLIPNLGLLEGGSLETLRIAERHAKPVRVVQLDHALSQDAIEDLRLWLADAQFDTLNVAGPRESKRPGIYQGDLRFAEPGLVRSCLATDRSTTPLVTGARRSILVAYEHPFYPQDFWTPTYP